MDRTIIDLNLNHYGTWIASVTDGQDFLLTRDAMVFSSTGTAMAVYGSGHDVRVEGSIAGQTGAQLGQDGAGDWGNRLDVRAGASIIGVDYGVAASGPARVDNAGMIKGGSFGLLMYRTDSDSATITNTGTISGNAAGIVVDSGPGPRTVLVNQGLIRGFGEGSSAYVGGSGVDVVTNKGRMVGHVELNGGADVFDNRGGTVVGVINAGEGDDRFLLGAKAETVQGSDGTDTLDFRSGTGLRVSLADASQNTGRAAGDLYASIENLWGSQTGSDVLTGDEGNNVLFGFGGADRLSGGGGIDGIDGGTGLDRLRGGAAGDAFRFASVAHGGDLILDWGDDDRIVIDASGFGGGLDAGVLEIAQFRLRGSSNLAGDVSDRFVFRDSDDTLWFDGDGTGNAYTSQLVADLQAGATFMASDIWLVA